MSTTDPVTVRRERQARRRPVQRRVVSIVLLTVLFIAGSSWGTILVIGFEHVGASPLAFPGWLALIFVALGILVWAATVNVRWRRRQRDEHHRAVEATGTLTIATVTEVPRGPSPEAGVCGRASRSPSPTPRERSAGSNASS